MTTPAETTVTEPEINADGPEGLPEGTDTGDVTSETPSAREARYRVRAREAETALAAATARIEALQRTEVERLASEHLAVPGDFWLSENSVADYVDPDTGSVDAERVAEDARLLLQERPRLGKHVGAFDPSQGLGGRAPQPRTPTFKDLFNRTSAPQLARVVRP